MKLDKRLLVIAALFLAVVLFVSISIQDPSFTGYATTDSQLGNLSASIQTYMACTWSDATLNVSFGSSLNPGTNDINASDNALLSPGTGYNVTVSTLSTTSADVTVAGNNLVSGANVLEIGNATWASNETSNDGANLIPGSSTSITGSSVDIATGVAADNTVHYRFWLDVPSGTVAGDYVGNYTIVCEEAS